MAAMPTTPLRVVAAPPAADAVRLFHRSQLQWARGVAEEVPVDGGTWLRNPDLQPLADANCVLDAALDPGETVAAWADRFAAIAVDCPVARVDVEPVVGGRPHGPDRRTPDPDRLATHVPGRVAPRPPSPGHQPRSHPT